MHDQARTDAKAQLARLISRVLEDSRVDEQEKAELQNFFAQALLTVSDVREVFGEHLRMLQEEVLEDGRVTDDERKKCKAVVDALKIPLRMLSPELLAIVLGQPIPKRA